VKAMSGLFLSISVGIWGFFYYFLHRSFLSFLVAYLLALVSIAI